MMKSLFLLACAASLLAAQSNPAPADPKDPVVVTIEGRSWTKSELERMINSVGGAAVTNFRANKRGFLEQFALLTKLAAIAEQEGFDKREPYAARLQFNRMQYLAAAITNEKEREMLILPEQQKQYYDQHRKDFTQARVKVLYLAFAPPGTPGAGNTRTEDQAQALAQDVVKQARAGTDFAALVKQHSDDPESRDKGGDFPLIKPTDNSLPAPIRTAIFSLQPGELSDPIRQANGLYLFRLEEFIIPTYDEVKDDIFRAIQRERFDQWMDGVRKQLKLEFPNEAYLMEPAQP